MERIPFHEVSELPRWFMLFSATSVADITNPDSRAYVVNEIQESIHTIPRLMQVMIRGCELYERPFYSLLRKTYHRAGASLLLVPYVKHDPTRDTQMQLSLKEQIRTNDHILIYDQTDELKVQLPGIAMSIILKMMGEPLPKITKDVTWNSHALMLATYTPDGDEFTLLHLFNEAVKDPVKEAAPFLTKLAPMLGRI